MSLLHRLAPRAILAFSLVLIVVAGARAEVPAFIKAAEWTEARTPGFVVLGDAGALATRDVARRLERLANLMTVASPGFEGIAPTGIRVLLLRDPEEVRTYSRTAKMENASAFSITGSEGDWIVIAASGHGLLGRDQALAHEYAHLYLNANFPSVPTWLNEGFAQFVSTARIRDTDAEVGRVDQEVLEFVAQQPSLSMTELFAITPEAAAYQRDNELQRSFYVQSWMLTHHLLSGSGGRRARMADWLGRLRRGEPARTSFLAAFGDHDYDLLHTETRGYVARIPFEPLRQVVFPARLVSAPVSERSVPVAEAFTRLGTLALSLGRDRGGWAREHLEHALALDTRDALAHAARGCALDLQGDPAAADSAYARATELAPTAPEPALWAALGTRQRFPLPQGPVRLGATPPPLLAARRHLLRALASTPDDPAALAAYGRTFLMDAAPDSSALRALERALESRPGNAEAAADLATLRARAGDRADAKRVPGAYAPAPALPTGARGVRDGADQILIEQADALAAEGRFAAADSLLRVVERETPDEELRMQVRRMLDELRERRGDQAFVELYERGRAQAAEGRFSDAQRSFELARDTVSAREPRLEAGRAIVRMRLLEATRDAQQAAQARRFTRAASLLDEALALPLGAEDRARIEPLRREIGAMADVDRALALVKAGKLREARAVYAAVAVASVSDALKAHARQRVADLDRALGAGR